MLSHRVLHVFRFFATSTSYKLGYNRPYIFISRKYISSLDTPEERERAEKWLQRFSKDKIPREMLTITFARSSGPGGQNVNKLNTKVDMRFVLDQAYWIPEYAKNKLLVQQANHVNKKGELVFTSDKTRSQLKNIEDCIDKLYAAIVNAAKVPKAPSEEQLQKIEEFKKAEHRRRKEEKQKRSAAKAQRKWRDD